MTLLDKMLQQWRIRKAGPFIRPGSRMLDIGCHNGELLWKFRDRLASGTGIDPLCKNSELAPGISLRQGLFPGALPAAEQQPFDLITALAVIEHIPEAELPHFFSSCFRLLRPGGLLVATVPHRHVDTILSILKTLRWARGMSAEEHHGYEVEQTIPLAQAAGLQLVQRSQFQLGLNNLFVFCRPNS